MVSSGDDVGVGECAWRISDWVCAVGDFFCGRGMDLVHDSRKPHRAITAKDCRREPRAEFAVGGSGIDCRKSCESVRVETLQAHLFLSDEPLFDGSH